MADRWTDADREKVGVALASRIPYSRHGQMCPVWRRRPSGVYTGDRRTPAEVELLVRCDCAILPRARLDATAVLDALTAAGRLRENAAADIETAFKERRDDIGQRPLHPEAIAAYEHAIAIARGRTDVG